MDELRARATCHISLYIRIHIKVNATLSFSVTARKTSTVSELFGLIEAEYAFQNHVDLLVDDFRHLLTHHDSSPTCAPLVCLGLLYEGHRLCPDDLVGLLPMDATVEVLSDSTFSEQHLYSQTYISHFIPYCTGEDALPPVLFWLEVEMAKREQSPSIFQYIERTFASPDTPLNLHLSADLEVSQRQVYCTIIRPLMLRFIDSEHFDSYCEERARGGDVPTAEVFCRNHDLVEGNLEDEEPFQSATPFERKLLLKRIRKLKGMLGEDVASEHIAPSLTEASTSSASDEDWPPQPTPLRQFKKLCSVLGGPDGLYSLSGEAPIHHIVPRLTRCRSSTEPTRSKTKAQMIRSMDKLHDRLGERPPPNLPAPTNDSPPPFDPHLSTHQKRILKLRKLLGPAVNLPPPTHLNKSYSASDIVSQSFT
ncbi:hypothetical protein L0F63_003824 [Massospora cicadina]|nr:hypothetical protein L0F63_003824 [Massospora cicadina]